MNAPVEFRTRSLTHLEQLEAESIEISWPSGQKQTFRNVEADKFYLVEEGKDQLAMQKIARRPLPLATASRRALR